MRRTMERSEAERRGKQRSMWEEEEERTMLEQRWLEQLVILRQYRGRLDQQRRWLEVKRWEEERKEEKRAGKSFLLMILKWISFLMRQTSFVVSFSQRVPWAKKRMKSVSASMPWTIAQALLVLWSVVWMFYDLFMGYPVPRDETIDWHELELSTTAATPHQRENASLDTCFHLNAECSTSSDLIQQTIDLAATPTAYLRPVLLGPEKPLNEISNPHPGLLNRGRQFTEIRSRRTAPGATMEVDGLIASTFSGLGHPMPPPVNQNHERTLAPASEVSTNTGAGQEGSGDDRRTPNNNRHNKSTDHTKKWICCDKEWSEKDFKRHRRSRLHDNITPYRCTVAGCDKKFPRTDNWRRHVKMHERTRGGASLAEGG